MVDLIMKKRLGEELSPCELDFIVNGFVEGSVPDYQMAAFMMAVCFNGMTGAETEALTRAMAHSGEILNLSDIPGVKVDKHSTGGVGDTTTLVAAPLVAACGGVVAKMSGRGLGHTGGTLDKLESVPGVNVAQPIGRFKAIVRETGLCVIGQTADIVPADKLMYALRDVTATVKSAPLIASSIMSKKIAAGADAIVLDVKTGAGAFMETLGEARTLARAMVEIGVRANKRIVAIITDMNEPLGLAVGNGLELKEAIDILSGKIGPGDPLYEVSMLIASKMLTLSDVAPDDETARARLKAALEGGQGLERLVAMIKALGGDASYVYEPLRLCQVKRHVPVPLEREGYVASIQALRIGMAAQLLGAGRATKADTIDPAVGLVMHKRPGTYIQRDEPVATLYVNDEAHLEEARRLVRSAVALSSEPPQRNPLVYETVG